MASYLYSVYNHSLESNVALPWHEPAPSSKIDFSFAWKPSSLCPPGKISWLHHWRRPDGGNWLSSARAGNGFLLRLAKSADFWLSGDGRTVRGTPLRALSPELLDHLLVGHALPFALTLRGLRVFHASGNCVGDKAVLFLGDTGTGKSTLAALLLARGFPALTDDCAVLIERQGKQTVLPSHPTLRLWPGVENAVLGGTGMSSPEEGKRILRLEGPTKFRVEPVPLSRLYVLAPDANRSATPALEPLAGPRALIELVSHSFRLDYSDRARLVGELKGLSNLVESVGVKRLRFSSGLKGLERAADLVLSELGQ